MYVLDSTHHRQLFLDNSQSIRLLKWFMHLSVEWLRLSCPDELVALGRRAGKRGYMYSDVPCRQKTSLGNQQITGVKARAMQRDVLW